MMNRTLMTSMREIREDDHLFLYNFIESSNLIAIGATLTERPEYSRRKLGIEKGHTTDVNINITLSHQSELNKLNKKVLLSICYGAKYSKAVFTCSAFIHGLSRSTVLRSGLLNSRLNFENNGIICK